MKKSYKILLIAVMLMLVIVALIACEDPEDPTVVTELATPQNLAANGSTISWSAVEGASSYEIVVDEGEAQKTTNVFYQLDISSIGSYAIKVRAVGTNSEGTTIYSEYATFTFTKTNKLQKPVIATRDNTDKNVTWSAVENASSYLVKVVNSSGESLYNEYQSALSFSFDDAKYESVGKYTIQIKAIPSETKTEYANSDAVVAYYVVSTTLNAPAISSVSQTAVTWTSISGSISYKLYVYKEGGAAPEWPKTFQTTSNSYAFSNMGISDLGTYYCKIQAIGDGEVYITSAVGDRNTDYDLTVIETFDYDSVDLTYDELAKKWKLSFDSINVDLLSDFVVTLQTTKADNSSSMPSISKTIKVEDGDMTYEVATGEFDATRTYYVEKAAGYVKNTEVYDSTTTYYTFDGASYTEATGIAYLENRVEYYINHTAAYKEAAKGEIEYIQVQENEAFNTRYTYYTRTGTGEPGDEYVYHLCESTYEEVGIYTSLVEDTSTIYLTHDSAYHTAGHYADLDPLDTSTVYWVYKPFNPSDFNTNYANYFKGLYKEFDKDIYDAAGDTYYLVSKATFEYDIDDLFFTEDAGVYTYLKSDIAYYGKTYKITINANGIKNTTITGDDAVCPDEYTSYRVPVLIDKTTEYYASKIKGYFSDGTDEENLAAYTKFVTKYDGYYAIESIGDMQYMAYKNDQKYVVMQDLDGSSYYWKPIPTFTGTFDGNNHKIENLVYKSDVQGTSTYAYTQGLFAKISGATIKNVYLLNISNKEEATAIAGGLVGLIDDPSTGPTSTIQNCYVKGAIKSTQYAGGIVGKIKDRATATTTDIINCQSDITITNAKNAGGIVGYIDGDTSMGVLVKNCISLGTITISDAYVSVGEYDTLKNMKYENTALSIYAKVDDEYIELTTYANVATESYFKDSSDKFYTEFFIKPSQLNDILYVGGLVGYANKATIDKSYADVTISLDYTDVYANVGGLAGKTIASEITSSHAGNQYSHDASKRMDLVVSAKQTDGVNKYGVGGLVGTLNSSTVQNSYSTIRVSASDYFAGFVGYIETDSTIERCYSTGGIAQQTATHKGAFIGVDDGTSSTFANCYYENYFGLTMTESIAEQKSLSEILTLCNTAAKGSFATIEGYLEPCVTGVAYTSSFTDSIKASAALTVEVYCANYNALTEETTITDLYDTDEDNIEIVIGDKYAKGTCLYILQQKGEDDGYGYDDGTGARVVIYVTIK